MTQIKPFATANGSDLLKKSLVKFSKKIYKIKHTPRRNHLKSLIGMTVCGFFPLNIWEVLKMSDRMRNILETCVKIDYFGEANPQLKTEVPYSVELFLANQNNIDRLNQAGITLVAAKGA